MLVIFTLAFASGVKFVVGHKGHEGGSTDAEKTPKQGDLKRNKPTNKKVSSAMELSDSSQEKVPHSYEEAYHSYEEAYKEEFEENTTRRETGTDYGEWLNECSLKEKGKKKQLQIPGCGGSVSLACPDGCLAIHKVFT